MRIQNKANNFLKQQMDNTLTLVTNNEMEENSFWLLEKLVLQLSYGNS